MARLFVACDLSDTVRTELSFVQCGIPGARWLAPDNLHLTLTFLGNVDGGTTIDRMVDALSVVRHEPLRLRLTGCGVFPPGGTPRVLWTGIDPARAVAELKAKIDRCLDQTSVVYERRKFHAHVTLARFANRPNTSAVAQYLIHHGAFSSTGFDVSEFVLYESILSPRGARYYRRAVFRLD